MKNILRIFTLLILGGCSGFMFTTTIEDKNNDGKPEVKVEIEKEINIGEFNEKI